MSGEKRIFKNFIVEIICRKTKPETHLRRPSCYRYNIQLLSISKQNGDIDYGKLISNHNGIKLDDIGNRKISVNFGGITKNDETLHSCTKRSQSACYVACFRSYWRSIKNRRYEDRGFVNKVLDYNAENSGMTRETPRI